MSKKLTCVEGFNKFLNQPFHRLVGSFMDCPSISDGASTLAAAPVETCVEEDRVREEVFSEGKFANIVDLH